MGEYWKRSWFERKNYDCILDILSEKEWDAILSWCRPEKETDAYLNSPLTTRVLATPIRLLFAHQVPDSVTKVSKSV